MIDETRKWLTRFWLFVAAATGLMGCAQTSVRTVDKPALQAQVMATERAFAQTMANRDHAAFTRLLSDETVFISGTKPLHGKAAVAEAWKRFYEKPIAPFAWQPEIVEVLDSGALALSSGPVFDMEGKKIAEFNSIWRLEAPGVWRIVFDKGNDVCQ